MARRYSVRADLAPVLADPVGPVAARRAQVVQVQVALARVPRPVARHEAHLVPAVPVDPVQVAPVPVPAVQAVPVGRLVQVPVVPEVLRAAEAWAMAVSR